MYLLMGPDGVVLIDCEFMVFDTIIATVCVFAYPTYRFSSGVN